MQDVVFGILSITVPILMFIIGAVWKMAMSRINKIEVDHKEDFVRLENDIKTIKADQKDHNIRLYDRVGALDKNITAWRMQMMEVYVRKEDCKEKHIS